MPVTHRERIERAITGDIPDSIPVSFWNHFPVDDQSPEKLAQSTIQFQRNYDLDFIKISPSSSFCIKDWSAADIWKGNPEGTREYLEPVIKKPEDWTRLEILDPKKGSLGKQLEAIKVIKKEIGSATPIIQTIFNPLSQAKNLVGKSNLFVHMRKHPTALSEGLKTITETTHAFIKECRKIGTDGIFYAVQHASYDMISEAEFESFIHKYDHGLFLSADEFWFNVLHIHGDNVMFDKLRDYPMHVFNWHDRETPPTLEEGKKITSKTVCGGLGRIETMVTGDEIKIHSEVKEAIAQTGGRNFILGTGCVLPLTTPSGNIRSAVKIARSIRPV